MGDSIDDSQIEVLDHTADMGFKVKGESLSAVFELSARALMSILTDVDTVAPKETIPVQVEAADLEGLMYTWLSEILYLFDGERLLFSSFKLESLNLCDEPLRLSARLSGESYKKDKHSVHTYVKAITFHQMKIIDQPPDCSARVFIDI